MVLDTEMPMKVEIVKRHLEGSIFSSQSSLTEENESSSLSSLIEENESLAAENARLKGSGYGMYPDNWQNAPWGVWEEYNNMYASMSAPWSSEWGQPEAFLPDAIFTSAFSDYAGNAAFGAAIAPTSVMMRNIPNNYTRAMVLRLLAKEGFSGTFDFFYLPIDLKKNSGLGYAFINFIDHNIAATFREHFSGFSNWGATSGKICQVTWSDRIQGLQAHVERYRNSAIMHKSIPEEYKPMIFINGVQMPFPHPTKTIHTPQEKVNRMRSRVPEMCGA
jgi:hypothetical protein